MVEVEFRQLYDLLVDYPEQIENIKEQYFLLLSELTSTSYLETQLFLTNIEKINKMGSIIVGIIIDNDNVVEIIASGTIIIEPKIIRGGQKVGHIEDIVVAKHMRGRGISQKILEGLKLIARENNCYKVILDCDNQVKDVYIKNGFTVKGVQMVEYF